MQGVPPGGAGGVALTEDGEAQREHNRRFPEASHDLLRFRTKAVLQIEGAAVRGGLREAARVAPEAVAVSRWHPQHVVARVAEGYLALVEAGMHPTKRRGAAMLALVVLAAFVWRASRRHAPR